MSNKPIKLSKNFTSDEFACRCCGQFVLDQRLIKALQELRDRVGPLHITSGYRCPDYNKAIGGEDGSLHTLGRAADIVATNCNLFTLLATSYTVKAFQCSGVGIYPHEGFLHVDVGRSKPARWGRLKKQGYVSLDRALKELKP